MICTEASTAEQGLLQGQPVFLHAEQCVSVADLNMLIRAAERGNGRLALANLERLWPKHRTIHDQLATGKLGEVGLVRIHRWYSLAPCVEHMWLLDIDLALWLIGRKPEIIYAAGSEDLSLALIHLGFAGGAMAQIDFTSRLPSGHGYRSLSVIGSCGAAYSDDHDNEQWLLAGGPPQGLGAGGSVRHVMATVVGYGAGVGDDADCAAMIAAWRSVLDVAEAIRQSLRSGKAILLGGVSQ